MKTNGLKMQVKMRKSVENIVARWTDSLEKCDNRNLGGVAIEIELGREKELSEAAAGYADYAEVRVQDVRWNGERKRDECDVYYVDRFGFINRI